MNQSTVDLGGLRSVVIDGLPAEATPALVVVLCHGFGAPGTDLVPIGGELLSRSPALREGVRFVFPAAPLSLEAMGMPGGRAWWMLDLDRLAAAVERGQVRDLRNEVPEGLVEARDLLLGLLADIERTMHVPATRIVLGGFSQGAMIATEVALRLPTGPAGLVAFSGTLLCESIWRDLATHHAPLDVLQSHGRQDPLLPFFAAEELRDLLNETGHDVEFIEFSGMHTIPAQAVQRFVALLERRLAAVSS